MCSSIIAFLIVNVHFVLLDCPPSNLLSKFIHEVAVHTSPPLVAIALLALYSVLISCNCLFNWELSALDFVIGLAGDGIVRPGDAIFENSYT